ncbi:MAG TPA: glycosyltransferase family A protein [Polyangiaceae bacterium]|nr:glycosyltransferase family A protein [Polyangiaceae bacterium]
MPPIVSVVIPTYKAAEWLELTLGSVIGQTYPHENIEVLVVDDKSPDDSVDIARRFLAEHPINSQVIACEKNGGAAATRNIGWRRASGAWIQFLDQDDLLEPHKLQLQVECALNAPEEVAVIYSAWQQLELQAGQWRRTGAVNQASLDGDQIVAILNDFSFGYVGPTLVRRAMLEKLNGFFEKPNLGEDIDLMLRIAMAGGRFRAARSEQPAFLYRQSPNSLWHSYIKNPQAMRNLLQTFKNVEDFLRARSSTGTPSIEARDALARRYTRMIDFYQQHDPQAFGQIITWLRGLGLAYPPQSSAPIRILSRLVGYENALRLRAAARRLRGAGNE